MFPLLLEVNHLSFLQVLWLYYIHESLVRCFLLWLELHIEELLSLSLSSKFLQSLGLSAIHAILSLDNRWFRLHVLKVVYFKQDLHRVFFLGFGF